MRSVTFTTPEFLWLAPLALAVVWWWMWRGRPAMRFSDTSLFSGPRGLRAILATWGGAIMRGLACLALVLACAGPRTPDERTRLPAEAVAITMIVDVSGSMTELVPWALGQPPVTRLQAAQKSFRLFVEGGDAPDGTKFESRPSDQVALIALSAIPETVCPLTLNHTVLMKVMDELQPQEALKAGTNIGDALALGVIRLDNISGAKTKILILLSDGEHLQMRDTQLRPQEAAQLAFNLGYKVYTIDAGGDPASMIDPKNRAAREEGRQTLREIAQITGGRAFEATSGSTMLAAYKEIDALERAKVETYQYRRYFEYYWWCAAAAVVLLLTAHLLERTLWRVVP